MKIDIHTHTKKTKSGDSIKRNIDGDSFSEIIKETEVEIIAITNHNHFDIKQYNEFIEKVDGYCLLWPGVELDILEDGRRGHLLVLVNPQNAESLSNKMTKLLEGMNEDNFSISINGTIENFESLDTIYIAHYYSKKPNLIDEDIEKLVRGVANPNRVIKEATNSISAGIYVNHGHKSIYGSDIQDWNKYIELSKELPDLRLPVESFEQFCLLLEKDETTINTVLDSKRHEIIKIKPFVDDEPIEIGIFNDINVLFGSKGTGKSEILKSISTYYNSNGLKTRVYESSVENLNDYYDIKGKTLKLDLEQLGIQSCSNEIEFVKNVNDESLTLLSNYERYFSVEMNNKRANAISIKNYDIEDTVNTDRRLNEVNEVYNILFDFSTFLDENQTFNKIVSVSLISQLKELIEKIGEEIVEEQEVRFIGSKSLRLYNNLIKVFNDEIAKKTGTPIKPYTTGFQIYARKRIGIEQSIKKVIENIDLEIPKISEYVGDLDEKGTLDFLTEVIIQTGNITNGNFDTLRNVNKTPQKEFVKKMREIAESIYKNDLFEKITELSLLNEVEKIKDIDDLIMFHRYFAIDGKLYKPSNGESSMVLLHKELREEKDIYILDEPEKSLGNDYINDIIVPLLKERAKMGKKIILATHDANIAVRTLPYNTIYRKHEIDKYSTYIGNPFSNNLVRADNHQDKMSWKEISMKTLEGGREAFGERGKIYGN